MLFLRLSVEFPLTPEPRLLAPDLDPAELYTMNQIGAFCSCEWPTARCYRNLGEEFPQQKAMFVTRLLGALQFSSLMSTKDPDGRAKSEPWRPAVGLAQPQPVKHSERCSQVQAGVRFLYLFSSQEFPNHPHEVPTRLS